LKLIWSIAVGRILKNLGASFMPMVCCNDDRESVKILHASIHPNDLPITKGSSA
jgi:hypothetical protein